MARYTVPFTQQGYDKMKHELAEHETKRPAIVEELRRASEMGDRSENAAYKVGRRKLSQTDSRIRFLKKTLDHAIIAEAMQSEFVVIGSIVKVHNGAKEVTFQIVGEHEADPVNAKLSFRSPVGQALLRKRVGDVVAITIPSGLMEYKILAISLA
ncbi:transcription elongation factor GreA [soil metagenome]